MVTGSVATIGAYFSDVRTAASACAAITAAGIRPAAMELMDAASLRAIDAYLGLDLASRGTAWLLVQTDGGASAGEAAQTLEIIRSLGGDAEMTTDPVEGERWLAIRRAIHPSLEALGTVLIEDVAVARSALPDMFAAINQIEVKYGVSIPNGGPRG